MHWVKGVILDIQFDATMYTIIFFFCIRLLYDWQLLRMPSMYSVARTVLLALKWKRHPTVVAPLIRNHHTRLQDVNRRYSMHSVARTVMMALRWRNHQTAVLANHNLTRWLNISRQHVASRREERWRQFHFMGILATFCRRWINYHRRLLTNPTGDVIPTSSAIAERLPVMCRLLNCVRCLRDVANVGFVTCKSIHPPLLCHNCEISEQSCACCPRERPLNAISIVTGHDILRSSVLVSFLLNCVECRTRIATVPFPFCTHPPLLCRLCQLMNNLMRCPYCRR
ncbi:uncharacterized protein LOC120333438 isoform X2 [Styela clava]